MMYNNLCNNKYLRQYTIIALSFYEVKEGEE